MWFKKKVGIDLGTANTLVYVVNKGIVLNEPTVVAYSQEDHDILAVGEDAREMLGRTPNTIVAARPMRDGVIADYTTTSAMVTYFLRKALNGRILWPEVMISIPGGSSQVEKRAVVAACKQAGASDVYLIEEPLAAAIGAKIPISQPSGHMIVNIGGGTAEIGILSLGQLVVFKTVRIAGTKLDEAIIHHMRKKHNMHVGERTAEEIKMKVGNAHILEPEKYEEIKMEVRGRDTQSGLPKIMEVGEISITEALQKPLKQIIEGIKEVFGESPPELSADIVDKGIVLSGGTALLINLDKFITYYTGVPAYVVDEPLFCVIRGIGMAIENLDSYKKAIR
ncbi:rod shape-determining protein [Candidatus Roizmanbacteria bacterium RIFCSPLOWO2_01_FULL_38_12]|uniref:Cell shape-determining protein MreB n=1 Tax=Candidatus Roizmanbacteria bacterium RIFCSPLOWO2_01_FULL_38_12 TaxID=1802061 RepID=A0A1F7IZ46_9BACT|nr:MAG: rod shape-determining protein [Candidatus Roizmanbacteria bacterium RIFCSPHIGHO2_01_FULL_38_15]OGK35645.1 MAG: rod shape-determining protein [Candidatus Roizmanbacteria bacterium RIFCSPHIGHO2_12_FULL_38_13]OGK48611.1 MAG: rod shape-determining protein [Candidatus Roizmanbacteria bacterium RIFCSPLOWO2_01_FULL_38_12]